jgi:hypothetical protein
MLQDGRKTAEQLQESTSSVGVRAGANPEWKDITQFGHLFLNFQRKRFLQMLRGQFEISLKYLNRKMRSENAITDSPYNFNQFVTRVTFLFSDKCH